MDIPINSVAIVRHRFYDSVTIHTQWGQMFYTTLDAGVDGVAYAKERFPGQRITFLDTTKDSQVEILQ